MSSVRMTAVCLLAAMTGNLEITWELLVRFPCQSDIAFEVLLKCGTTPKFPEAHVFACCWIDARASTEHRLDERGKPQRFFTFTDLSFYFLVDFSFYPSCASVCL